MANSRFPIGATVTATQLAEDPYGLFAELQQAEPVTWVANYNFWLITRYSDVVEILKDADTFTMVSPPNQINPMDALFGEMMLSMDGERHKQTRDVFMPPFRPKHVRTFYKDLIDAIVDQLIEELRGQSTVDLTRGFADKIAIYTVVAALGLNVNDIDTFRDWYDAFGAAIGSYEQDAALTSRGQAAFKAFETLILAQIEGLRQTPNNSILSEIVHSPQQLEREQIVSNCALTFFGGVETTTSMISNALWCLLTHPDALATVRTSAEALTNAIEESMRFESAVQSAMRFPTKDVTVLGVEIAKGEKIYCSLSAANRDATVFDAPNRFEIQRENAHKHLGFAYGAHFCFGAPLARLEAFTGIQALLQSFPALALVDAAHSRPYGHEFRAPRALQVTGL